MNLSRCCIVHPVAIWACNPLEVNILNLKKVTQTHLVWPDIVCVCVRVFALQPFFYFCILYLMCETFCNFEVRILTLTFRIWK